MSLHFMFAAAGFAITFILLFYFTAKYREAAAGAENFETASPSPAQAQSAAQRTPATVAATIKRASMGGPYGAMSLEIEDLKEKLKEAHYRGEEQRLVSENRTAEILKSIAKLETRINNFEEEYVKKLQPTLMSLIADLEKIKTPGNH